MEGFNLLNKAFDSRVRLGLMSILSVNEWISYKEVKNLLDITDGNLASHVQALEKINFLEIKKQFIGKKPLTTYRITTIGKNAFKDHISGLEKLIKKVISNGQLTATNDYSSIKEADVILITVGTPLKEDGSADKSAINNVVTSISPYIKDGQLIIVKSTVPPFTTENDICTPLRKISKVHVAFCPERLAEGNAIEECKSIPVVVGGVDKESGEKAQEFWGKQFKRKMYKC